MYSELTGKVVVLSGAGGALGSAVARRFHEEHARLVLIDRNLEALENMAAELGLKSGDYLTGAVDLTQSASVGSFLTQTVSAFGQIDIVVNIAGGFRYSGPAYEANPEDLDAMFQINVKTAYLLSSLAAKQMVAAGRAGRIINVGARVALSGAANMAAYAASKAAVVNLTESMAAELLGKNITVNAVLPSTIDTRANRQSMPNADFEKWVKPESLAAIIAFLASDSSRDISGAAIPVYGKA